MQYLRGLMSTASLPLSSPVLSLPQGAISQIVAVPVNLSIRRRPSPLQGAALEMIAHAIEYLVDSRYGFADEAALDVLKQASRGIFSECPEVLPFATRVRRRFHLC